MKPDKPVKSGILHTFHGVFNNHNRTKGVFRINVFARLYLRISEYMAARGPYVLFRKPAARTWNRGIGKKSAEAATPPPHFLCPIINQKGGPLLQAPAVPGSSLHIPAGKGKKVKLLRAYMHEAKPLVPSPQNAVFLHNTQGHTCAIQLFSPAQGKLQ